MRHCALSYVDYGFISDFHSSFSTLSALCAHFTVIRVQIVAHNVGTPQPMPYAMSSVVRYMPTIKDAPRTTEGIDQNHNSCSNNARKRGEASYRAIAAARYFLPPCPSTAQRSSSRQKVRGGQTEVLICELSRKYISLHRLWAAQPLTMNIAPVTTMPTGIGRDRAFTEGW